MFQLSSVEQRHNVANEAVNVQSAPGKYHPKDKTLCFPLVLETITRCSCILLPAWIVVQLR